MKARREHRRSRSWFGRVLGSAAGIAAIVYGVRRLPSVGALGVALAGVALLWRSARRGHGRRARVVPGAAPVPRPRDEAAPAPDVVDQASEESFPASDAPGWHSSTIG